MALWEKLETRGNVEDRRGLPVAVGGISLTGIAILLLVNTLLGGDPADVLRQLENVPIESRQNISAEDFEGEDEYEVFASTVLGSNNEMWADIFSRSGKEYTAPKLVLFRTATESSCGIASSEVGPHYCPIDSTIYIDETFFDELTRRFGAQGGDVAEAYVIAHEVAHHAQNELGIMSEVNNLRELEPTSANKLSIKQELQADCFAGLWGNSIKDTGVFLPGEIGEAMDAVAAVGDDRIQESITGRISPEKWTHGSSEERVYWFTVGFEKGNLRDCNTFN